MAVLDNACYAGSYAEAAPSPLCWCSCTRGLHGGSPLQLMVLLVMVGLLLLLGIVLLPFTLLLNPPVVALSMQVAQLCDCISILQVQCARNCYRSRPAPCKGLKTLLQAASRRLGCLAMVIIIIS